MKLLLGLMMAALLMTALSAMAQADDQREAKPRFKGVELYSWKDKEGQWVFVLLDGTNRLKTEAEVKGTKNPSRGVEELKKALARLAVGEQVVWTHPIDGFEFPPKATRTDIAKAAADAKINLTAAAPND
jgi:hypothetical protein